MCIFHSEFAPCFAALKAPEVYLAAMPDAKQEGKMELLKDLETLIVMAVPTLVVVLAALVSIL